MTDDDHMRHALALGRRALGATGARPAVGCVIVRDGNIVGVGSTGEGERPTRKQRRSPWPELRRAERPPS